MQKFLEKANNLFNLKAVPFLEEYIRIPNCSPGFPDFYSQETTEQAVRLLSGWAKKQSIRDMKVEVLEIPELTPLIYIDMPASVGKEHLGTAILYGHGDKQPPFEGWGEGLYPYVPVFRSDRLYGRGSADDGYAIFSSLLAIQILQESSIPHGRIVVIIEFSEESGSPHLPAYFELMKERLGAPSLLICLDSGCGTYDRIWLTSSLRGIANGILKIGVMSQGVHSGHVTGLVPNPWTIFCSLLSRLRREDTDEVVPRELYVEIPKQRLQQAHSITKILGERIISEIPLLKGVSPRGSVLATQLINSTWIPGLTITGIDGAPSISQAGNVMLPNLEFVLSMRLPPTLDPDIASEIIKNTLEKNPPYGAHVSFTPTQAASGWHAKPLSPWLEKSLDEASLLYFGNEMMHQGEGGTIPFIHFLGNLFPKTEMVITGLLGPESNAHGPDEFLHIPSACKLTATVAKIIADHAAK